MTRGTTQHRAVRNSQTAGKTREPEYNAKRHYALAFFLLAGYASAAVLHVGPGQQYAMPCLALAAAAAGDTIQIDASGDYSGDVCAWATDDLTIVGVHGRPKIDAAGPVAEGRGIWIISGKNTTVENIE